MGVKVTKYITLSSRYAEYGDDGYFIEPQIIEMMLFDELRLKNVEEFVNGANITITENEIKEFLEKKLEEENPKLKKRMEAPRQTSSIINLGKASAEAIISSLERFKDELSAVRYYFEPYSLQYFKIYTSILKEKCQTLCSVLSDIKKCKTEEVSEEALQRFKDLDFHINSKGNIYFKDAERLADAIIYNVKDLEEKVQTGNNPEIYLTFKESKHDLMRDDIWECDIYPRKEIQIKDRYYAHLPEFIALSETQQTQVQKEDLENMTRWIEMDLYDDEDDVYEKSAVLKKVKNDN